MDLSLVVGWVAIGALMGLMSLTAAINAFSLA
jgi:hypothetical protein